jgi:TolA-binding protein
LTAKRRECYGSTVRVTFARGGSARRAAAIAAATILITGGAGGCAGLGGGAGGDAKTPTDPVVLLRQDVDRLRGELTELRVLVDTVQRSGREHADRAASETRAEMDAVQKALEASARHDLQRQVEVLDAQARRIDVLDKRVAEQGQALRRVELVLTGIESQLARVLESSPAPTGRARPGGPARAGGPGSTDEAGAGNSSAPGAATTGAAGADLTPPAMLGLARTPRSPASSAPGGEAKADSAASRPATPASASPSAPAPETRTSAPARPSSDEARPQAKAGTPAREAKTAPTERPATAMAARDPKARAGAAAPAGGSSTARELFTRAMQSWDKGERGQAVLDFEELVQRFPSDPLVAPAQFRIGEAYYAARDFERAAQAYRKAVDLDPTGKETPLALLRLGLAYRAQKREADARQAWSQLVRDFPESDVTEEARRALRGR